MKELAIEAAEATEARIVLGKIEKLVEDAVVAVTDRGAVSFYALSPKHYHAMKYRASIDTGDLQKLTAEYDHMVASMQKPSHAAAVDRLMSISETDLRAALDAEYDLSPSPVKVR